MTARATTDDDGGAVERVRALLADRSVREVRMFGGLAFMVDGHLAVAASRTGGLLVRVDPDEADELLGAGVEVMEMNGIRKPGWLWVEADALADGAAIDAWVDRALAFVGTLPPK